MHSANHLFVLQFINHFSIGGSALIGGIENVYHDPCQDWLDLINMKLTSPNYPDAYDPLTDCTWTIIAPPEQYVTLDFKVIDVNSKSLVNLIELQVYCIFYPYACNSTNSKSFHVPTVFI